MDWKERQEQWRLFAAWEANELRERPPDLASAIAWFEGAARLAAALDPEWGSLQRLEEHCQHLGRVRAALSKLRFPE